MHFNESEKLCKDEKGIYYNFNKLTWRRHGIHIHLVGSGRLDDEPAAAGWNPGLAAGEQGGTSGRCGPAVGHDEGKGSRGVCDGLHARVPDRRPVAVARLRAQGIILEEAH